MSSLLNVGNRKIREKVVMPQIDKILAAVFYAVSSFAVIFINKAVLMEFSFPNYDFLAFFQFVVTSFVLITLVFFNKVDIPYITKDICIEIIPISLMFLGNIISGLGGKELIIFRLQLIISFFYFRN
jgi:solute carrier family 35 protein